MKHGFFSLGKFVCGVAIALTSVIACKHASQSSVEALQSEMSSLISSVQSVVVVPDYEDGSVKMTDGGGNVLRFEVYPLAAAQKIVTSMGRSAFSLDCVLTDTKSSPLINIPITNVSFDGAFLSIVADGSGLQDKIKSGISPANARLRITDGRVTRSSEYFALTYYTSSGEPVLVGTEHLSAVSVVLKGKALVNETDKDVEYGFVYATSALSLAGNPMTIIADNINADANYSVVLKGQTPNTTYYFRSILFKNGTLYYGETMSFKTKEISSLIETLDASDPASTNATLNAKLDLSDALYETLEYGFYWGTSETSQNTYIKCENLAENVFSALLDGLSHNTQYWYKSYVKIDNQTFYGELKTFSTGVVPVVSVSLKPSVVAHAIDSTWTLTPVILPATATNKAVTWESSDESVVTVDASGKPLQSWRVLILPYLGADAKALYDKINLDEPWDSEANAAFHSQVPDVFRCPSATDMKEGETIYSVLLGDEGLFDESGVGKDLKEMASLPGRDVWRQFFVVERSKPVCWMAPDQELKIADFTVDEKTDMKNFYENRRHVGGMNYSNPGGSGRFGSEADRYEDFVSLLRGLPEPPKKSETDDAELPVEDEPATEESVAEEPVTEEPTSEEPAVEESAAEGPATEEIAVEERASEEPTVEESTPEAPAIEEPAVEEQPTVEEPVETVDVPQ